MSTSYKENLYKKDKGRDKKKKRTLVDFKIWLYVFGIL